MKLIPLTQGKFAMVDDADYDEISKHNWYTHGSRHTFYAYRKTSGSRANRKSLIMHRVLLGVTDSTIHIDHRDGNGLNNQRSNIRVATASQNMANRRKIGGVSKHLGVYYNKVAKKWASAVSKNNVKYRLGYFDNENDAAIAYNKKAIELHGDFAKLNIVNPS